LIQISPSASASQPVSARPALLASGGTHAFARVLKSALAPPDGAPAEAEGETPQGELTVRQKLAGDGKALPDSPEGEADGKPDTDDKSEDVAFAWFGGAFVLPQHAPLLPKLPVGARAIQLPEGQIAAATAASLPGTAPVAADPAPAPTTPEAAVQGTAAIDPKAIAVPASPVAAPEPRAVQPDAQPAVERTAGPVRIELPPAQETAHRVQTTTLAAIQPRAETIHAAAAAIAPTAIEAPSPRRQARSETGISSLTAPAATQASTAQAVPATADAQQPALDLRSRDGMQAMVDRIEALRDTPGSRETSIRLSPDALGSVSISIRQEGDRVHVHFTADNASARAALAEAQPRLAELAESRGLRLGQTTVDGGSAGQGQRQDAAPQPIFTTAPASAPGGEPATDADDRVA
jgi:flagellar hook-length control protein FliK